MKTRVSRLLFLGLIAALTVPAKAEPLESIPQECALVFRFDSIDKFVKNTNDMLAGIGGLAQAASAGMESELVGGMFELKKDGAGLDRSAPAYAVLFPINGSGPPVVWFVKAKDEKALRTAIANSDSPSESAGPGKFKKLEGARTGYIAKMGEYTMYTLNETVAEMVADSKGSLKLPAMAVKEAKIGDASLIVNTAHLVEKFQQEIALAKEQVLDGIDSLPDEQLGPSGEATKAAYKKIVGMVMDAASDSEYIVGRANMSAKGAAISSLLGFRKDSDAGKFIASMTTEEMDILELLPGGQPMYFAAKFDYSTIGGDFFKEFLAAQVGNSEKLKKAFDEMAKSGIGAMAASFAFPSGNKGIQSTMLEKATDIKKLRASYAKYMAAMGDINNGGIKQSVEYKSDVEKYKKFKIDVAKTNITVTDDAPAEAKMILEGMYKKMFGGDGLQSRITTVEDMLLQVTSNDASEIRKAIDRLESGKATLGLADAYSDTRDNLGDETALLVLVDISQMIAGGFNMVKDIEPFNQLLANVPFNFEVKESTSYAGFSAGKQGSSIEAKAYIPVDQVKSLMAPFLGLGL